MHWCLTVPAKQQRFRQILFKWKESRACRLRARMSLMVTPENKTMSAMPLTPMPCIPLTTTPWVPGSPTVLIGNKPALNQNCKLMCSWGGVIQINNPGNRTIQVP
ncbi:MAG: DUF4280 domain-containing protein [Lachnospiraceae bacterium]|nr:DUF4280 domain-containing protein [Lachnospiraceae bacterium]